MTHFGGQGADADVPEMVIPFAPASDPPDVIRSARRSGAPIPLIKFRMKQNAYDFRRFQEELAALDRKDNTAHTPERASEKTGAADRLAQAKAEFLALRKRYRLTVAHVVAFFPEEEGIAYLQELIAEQEEKPRRRPRNTTFPMP